jgi:hypothetical protein
LGIGQHATEYSMPTAGVHPVPPSPAPPELEPEPDPELEPELEPEPDPDPELDPELEPLDGLTPLDEPPGDPDDPLEVAPELPEEEDDEAPEEPLPAEPSKSPPPEDPGTLPNPGPEGADVPHEAAKHPATAYSAHRRRSMASTFRRAASALGRSVGQCPKKLTHMECVLGGSEAQRLRRI